REPEQIQKRDKAEKEGHAFGLAIIAVYKELESRNAKDSNTYKVASSYIEKVHNELNAIYRHYPRNSKQKQQAVETYKADVSTQFEKAITRAVVQDIDR